MKQFLTAASLLAGLVASGGEPAQACVLLVADLHGAAVYADRPAARPEDRWPVQLLQCFPAGKTVILETGARMTLYYPARGEAVELRGPGSYQLAAEAVRPLSSAPAPTRLQLNAAFQDIRLDRTRLTPAGVRMRDPRVVTGVVLREPAGIVLGEAAPVFRWEPVEGAREYRFRLADARRGALFEVQTQATEVVLPLERRLPAGERLMWQVEAVLAAGQKRSRWQEFVLATPAAQQLAARIDAVVPSPSAAERNLREVLLLQSMTGDLGEH